jgi:3',5'-nucleoside bisphosphate phosphatase
MIDLHIHTTCSDGKNTPAVMVGYAHELGLRAISITDHDTTDGVHEASEAAGDQLIVIPGVELSASEGTTPIHILAYGIDPQNSDLIVLLDAVRDERHGRAISIVSELNTLGVDVSMDMVREMSGEAPITRAHIGYALIQNGYVRNTGEAFGRYLSNDAPAFIPQRALSVEDAIAVIHSAGGVAIYAHPGSTRRDEIIGQMVHAGLDGIEATHPNHSSTIRTHYENLAKKHGLIATGGSDAHNAARMLSCAESQPVSDTILTPLLDAISTRQHGPMDGTQFHLTPSVTENNDSMNRTDF